MKNIGGSSFGYCTGLKNVVIPNSVIRIEDSAFAFCSGLSSVVIPKSVTKINKDAFAGCSEKLVIYGSKGSNAEKYAKKSGYTFRIK